VVAVAPPGPAAPPCPPMFPVPVVPPPDSPPPPEPGLSEQCVFVHRTIAVGLPKSSQAAMSDRQAK
jgi:hypothetical protein